MELKLEIEQLIEVAKCMNNSKDAIQELLKYLDPEAEVMSFWIGDGKDAYVDVVKRFRDKVTEYSVVLSDTTHTLAESLNMYIENETMIAKEIIQIPADDIF